MKKGKIIVIEGSCDGVGKTTQYKMLKERLEKEGNCVSCHHFPSYDFYQGQGVNCYLRGEFGSASDLSVYFVNNLFAYDRMITWKTMLEKKYLEGDIILLDRYTTSSLIYQGANISDREEKRQFVDYVCDFEYNKLGIPKPDLVIFLSAPFDLITEIRGKRTNNEGISNDIHERDMEFMRRVYDNARYVSSYLGFEPVECSYGDKMRSIEEIHEDVYKLVKKIER